MRKSKFSEAQIFDILKEHEAGLTAAEVARKYDISAQTLYRWKSKYGGMELSEVKRLKALEEENRRLKAAVADLTLDVQVYKEIVEKKL